MDFKPSRASGVPPPATTTPTMVQSTRKALGIDARYVISIPGILKLAEIAIGIICAAVCGPAYFSGNQFFLFVVITCIIITFILLFLNFAKIPKLFALPRGIKWSFIEFVYAATATIFYVLAASVQVARTNLPGGGDNAGSTYSRYTAAGIIAFLNLLLYAADTFVHYRAYRDNRLQGPV